MMEDSEKRVQAENSTLDQTNNLTEEQIVSEYPTNAQNAQTNVEEITVSTSNVDSSLVFFNMPNINTDNKTVSITASQGTPMLVLSNNSEKGTVEANVLIEEQQVITRLVKLSSDLPNLHALAQANLVVQTQERIAKEYGILTNNIQNTKINQEKTKAEDKYFICKTDGCGRTFSTQGYYRYHQAVHNGHKSLKCSYEGCNRKFSWPAHLKYHLLTHTGKRLYKCEHEGCDKSFYTAQRLTVHMRTHSGDRPYVCLEPDCHKSFTTAGNLKNHMRVHTGERPYVCGVEHCGRRFAEYSSLRKHKLVHSGDKPFVCDICGKGFSQSGSRNVHIKRHQAADKWKNADQNSNSEFEQSGESGLVKMKSQVVPGLETDVFVLRQNDEMLEYQDQVVTVTTQSDSDTGMTREMLASEGILGQTDISESSQSSIPSHNPTGANVVVLSQPQEIVTMTTSFHEQNTREEIVYDSNLLHADLDHEEITGHELTVETLPQSHISSQSSLADSGTQSRTVMDPMMENDEYDCAGL